MRMTPMNCNGRPALPDLGLPPHAPSHQASSPDGLRTDLHGQEKAAASPSTGRRCRADGTLPPLSMPGRCPESPSASSLDAVDRGCGGEGNRRCTCVWTSRVWDDSCGGIAQ